MTTNPFFGVFFSGASYPIFSSSCTQIDASHWVLDVCTSVAPNYWDLKEVSLFLTAPGALEAAAAAIGGGGAEVGLALYSRAATGDWAFRGAVHSGCPSAVMLTQWPLSDSDLPPPGPGVVQIGISLEPLASVLSQLGTQIGSKEDFARKVATDLFRFLQSFQTVQMGDRIVAPANALDRWFVRFQEKFRKDPDFLTRRKVDE
uniref:Hikeshi-like C-terminal domain-containing protein n=1 Tax=Polytomella parva TaxID=51329 RepID=A0A7S0UKF1_9CHLO|mmetsp:Transcript_12562/g.22466  ORF Transcript_12562/g.22466 Transcript_12562/m.22466 type:complete len:203 (+) Transcript_12562:79-687(+)